MHGILLCGPLARILALFELLLDGFMTSLNLISLTLELILCDLLLLELVYEDSLFFFDLTSHSVLLHQTLLEVLDSDGHAVAFILPEERFGCYIANGPLDIISCLLCVLQLTLDIRHFLCLQL